MQNRMNVPCDADCTPQYQCSFCGVMIHRFVISAGDRQKIVCRRCFNGARYREHVGRINEQNKKAK